MTSPDRQAFHLIPAADWDAAPAGGALRPASLATEGFVHLTHRAADLVDVANAFYRSEAGPHVVLTVDLDALSVPWRYDGDRRFPHVYGPLDRAAITGVRSILRGPGGEFLPFE